MMQTWFTRILSAVLSVLIAFTGGLCHVGDAGSAFSAKDEKHVLLNVAVVSDLHTNGLTTHRHNVKLMRLFSGIASSGTPLDALVMPGDLTETAQRIEYANLSRMLTSAVRTDNFLPALGNHDVRGLMGIKEYKKNMRNYYAFCEDVGVQTDKPYRAQTVGGYTFLVLGSESEEKDCAYISPAQLLWLDETLHTAQKNKRPVFVVCHQPLAHTGNVDKVWPVAGTLGAQSDAVEAILKKYAAAGLPILFLSGHLHEEFGAYSFEKLHRNFYCLNLPSAQYNDGGRGVMLEVYSRRILLRARDFISGEWLQTYVIPLK